MVKQKITDNFPCLAGKTAIFFRYDRWNRNAILKTNLRLDKDVFLIFCGCQSIEFSVGLSLDDVEVIWESNPLIFSAPFHNFLLKCESVEVWSEDDFRAYDSSLYKRLGEERRYGVRKPITSIDELR